VFRLENLQLRPARQKLIHEAFEIGRQVLQHHERHTGVGGNVGEEFFEGVQTAG